MGGGAGAACCVLLHHAAFPAASCFRLESAHIPASGARPPRQTLPGRSLLPALFVFCLTSLTASQFFFHKALVPAKECTGQHSLRQEVCPAAGSYKQPYNKQKRSHEPLPATGGNPAPAGESTPAFRDRGTEATLQPPGWHSAALTNSRRSLLMFTPATGSVAAQPGGQGKEGAIAVP